MKVRWLKEAKNTLDQHYERVRDLNPIAARRIFVRIVTSTRRLGQFPNSGRMGNESGTRELVVPGVPYTVVYRVQDSSVEILRVFHDAQLRTDVLK
jgi:plasmid stabilization system protein ParE